MAVTAKFVKIKVYFSYQFDEFFCCLVKFLETDQSGILTESLTGHVESVLLDETDGTATLDAAMTETLARGILSFV